MEADRFPSCVLVTDVWRGGIGILRKAQQITRWVDELDGMGGWHPRETGRASPRSSPSIFYALDS